jgi:hypothetical protein
MITFSISSLVAMNIGWIVGQLLIFTISPKEAKYPALDMIMSVMIFSFGLYLFHGQ